MASETEPQVGVAVDISPSKDGGVLKEIIKLGTGTASPQKGNKVYVHYTGTLTDGTVFDSSRDRNEMFDFALGKGQVIKAWDIGVASMKAGEVCKLTCASEYAYGKSGSPPKIPPDSTLVFEVELFRWDLEDLTPNCDKGVLREIIKEGEGDDSPNEGASVDIHYCGRYEDRVFETQDIVYPLGEGTEHGLVDGIDVALRSFKKGEVSKLIMSPKYAFGEQGNSKFSIGPNSSVEYEVTLNSFEKVKESWEMNSDEKIEQSEIVKDKGTKFFKDGNYDKASKLYQKIVNFLQHESGLEEDQQKKRDSLLLAGYLNLAACYLKLNKPLKVIENADKALEIQTDNSKGLFRRGQAYYATKDYARAKSDFEKVVGVDPENKAAMKQIQLCVASIKKQLDDEKQMYKNIFGKMYNNEKQNGAEQTAK